MCYHYDFEYNYANSICRAEANTEKYSKRTKARMWADAQRDGRPAEYRPVGALFESSVIPLLVPRRNLRAMQ